MTNIGDMTSSPHASNMSSTSPKVFLVLYVSYEVGDNCVETIDTQWD